LTKNRFAVFVVDLFSVLCHHFVTNSQGACHQAGKETVQHGKAHGVYGTETRELLASESQQEVDRGYTHPNHAGDEGGGGGGGGAANARN
jgi:hypothetical protein